MGADIKQKGEGAQTNVRLSTVTATSLFNGVLSAKVSPTPSTKKEHTAMVVFGVDSLPLSIITYWLITPTALPAFAEAAIPADRKMKRLNYSTM